MIFEKYIDINLHFQNSINVGLDLFNDEKVNTYIPTATGVDFLNHFIDNLLDKNGDRSSMLIAPYGKGKSHAILVLLYLLYSNNYDAIAMLLNKIEQKDIDLFNKINNLREKKYLPIIVSNTRGTLNQSLFQSLQKALSNFDIHDIVIDTDFEAIQQRIKEWKTSYPQTYETFEIELKNRKIALKDFIKQLKHYDEKAIATFKEIHKQILAGADYVSGKSLEVADYYKEVTNSLIQKYDYDGVYIIFDEFSKFLESRDEDTISNDMKIIQDLAELSNSSAELNINLMLVLHKPINDYLSVDKNIRNAFKGIEGRVFPYYFTTTLQNSFDLISNVLQNKENYCEVKKANEEINKGIVDSVNRTPGFYVDLDEYYRDNQLIDALYPLHPITAYLLVKVNEKVAQNERTLFTFLAKNSRYAIPHIITNEYDYPYVLAPVIFDYFKKQFIEEKDNIAINSIANKALSALKVVDDQHEKDFIKTLALLLIINEKELLPTNISIIANALLIAKDECKTIVKNLIDKNVLIKRQNGQIQFKVNMDLDINKKIKNLIHTKFTRVNLEEELKNILENKFVYPKTYNIVHAITRYYEVEFIQEENFLKLLTTKGYFERDSKDGVILNVLRTRKTNKDTVKEHTHELNNDRVVVVYPKKYFDYEKEVKKLLAIEDLRNDSKFIEENNLISTELDMLLKDTRISILNQLNKDYSLVSEELDLFNSYNNNELNTEQRTLSKNRVLGQIFEGVFNEYPTINLEMINKQRVVGTYKTARQAVSDKLLARSYNLENLGTSPEDTILNCVFNETGLLDRDNIVTEELQHVLTHIRNFLNQESGSFKEIYDVLTLPPYGLRKGVIPLLLAYEIGELGHSFICYFKTQEVTLDGKLLEQINEKPEDYSFIINEESAALEDYIRSLGVLFQSHLEGDMIKNYSLLVSDIQNWFNGLPKLTKLMIGSDGIEGKSYKLLKKHLLQQNINPSEFVLKLIPKITNREREDSVAVLETMKANLDNYLSNYLYKVKGEVNKVLGFDEETRLMQSLLFWIEEHQATLESKVLDNATKHMITYVTKNTDINENVLINKIAYFYTSLFIEDWSLNTMELFVEQFKVIKEYEVKEEATDESNQILLQIDGKQIKKQFDEELDDSTELLENIIVDAMDDYGDVLTNEQKLALLVKIMKNYI